MKLADKINTIARQIDDVADQEKAALETTRQILEAIKEAVPKTERPEIPFVVAAMTRAEAEQLAQGCPPGIFQDQNSPLEYDRFREFKKLLDPAIATEAVRAAWLSHYGKHREAWKPHIYRGEPEQPAIVEVIEEIVLQSHAMFERKFWPDFVGSGSGLFAAESACQSAAWDALQDGYILVVDGISLFYPHIRDTLAKFAFKQKRGGLLIFFQQKAALHEIDRCIEAEIRKGVPAAFGRFARNLDLLYEIGVNHPGRVPRWLAASVPELLRRQKILLPQPANNWPVQTHGSTPRGPLV
jgi:hypothetical protein